MLWATRARYVDEVKYKVHHPWSGLVRFFMADLPVFRCAHHGITNEPFASEVYQIFETYTRTREVRKSLVTMHLHSCAQCTGSKKAINNPKDSSNQSIHVSTSIYAAALLLSSQSSFPVDHPETTSQTVPTNPSNPDIATPPFLEEADPTATALDVVAIVTPGITKT